MPSGELFDEFGLLQSSAEKFTTQFRGKDDAMDGGSLAFSAITTHGRHSVGHSGAVARIQNPALSDRLDVICSLARL